MQKSVENIWENIWKDKKGKIVIWQMPNIPLIIWAVATVVSLIVTGKSADVFQWIGDIALVVWSLLEIIKGVNYFRRILGLVVFVFSVLSIIKLL
jgi:hypothetical protein